MVQPGISDKRKVTGVFEPSMISCPNQSGSSETFHMFGGFQAPVAALRIDSIDLKDGGSIKGAVIAATGPLDDKAAEVSISGTFVAESCRRKW